MKTGKGTTENRWLIAKQKGPFSNRSYAMKDLKCSLPFDVFVRSHDIMLSTSVAKSLRRICLITDWSFYDLDIKLRNMISNEKVEELDQIVYGETLKPLEDRLQAEYNRINLFCEQCGLKPSQRKSENISVDLRHPDGHRFFDLLVGLDNMVCQLDGLRSNGIITEIEYKEKISNCRNSLEKAAIGIHKLVGQALKQAEKENGEACAEEPEEGEKDRDLSKILAKLNKIFQCSSGSPLKKKKKID
jgi:hypothetical protein